MQHEIVKGPGDRGGLWVGFDVFCLSLMTVAFLQHPFSIICVCVCVFVTSGVTSRFGNF